MQHALLNKYNVPVPRYTSYPPANYFTDAFRQSHLLEAIEASNSQKPDSISVYFHMPFCHHLCYYCGCNSYPAPKKEKIDAYLEALHKEIDMVLGRIDTSRKVSQIHFGGGTPTFFPIEALKDLNSHVLDRFETIDRPEIAAECHPGWLGEEEWRKLIDAGFTRLSIGIQDFNLDVLKAVNRQPAKMPVGDIVAMLHGAGIKVNFDFLYGLPLQTAESFGRSIRKAVELQPDRLVTFSYAHVPAMFPRQRVLDKLGLPDPAEKERMFGEAAAILEAAGYKSIGLDHFVKPDDELYDALLGGQLHRNFQGYCTRRTTGQVYAFGASAISQLGSAYAQNTKDISEYISAIGEGRIPVAKGYTLAADQQITREVIEMLMCNYAISWSCLADRMGLAAETIQGAINYDESRLREFAADGIIEYSPEQIVMTPGGRLFVRNVAAALDPLMINTGKSFSKPV